MNIDKHERIIIKVGSNVLTADSGLPNAGRMSQLVEQLATLQKEGHEVVLISSGAVASGRSSITIDERKNPVASRQLLAAVGQVHLIKNYAALFSNHQLLCAQVLATKEDFKGRNHYLNMKNCLEVLLQQKVVPIVNENDVVSITELMFTDNDELAGLVTAMLNADRLIILSNVDGIFNGDPKVEGSSVIEKIGLQDTSVIDSIGKTKSTFGRGGMLTKFKIARKVSGLGVHVHIANGTRDNVILDVLKDSVTHSHFLPGKAASNKKRWVAHSAHLAKATITINDGAKAALTSGSAASLLPVGIIKIENDFQKGDIVKLIDQRGSQVGFGIAEYGTAKAQERRGQKRSRPLVHYDYLYINT